jgi:hypothetical protein
MIKGIAHSVLVIICVYCVVVLGSCKNKKKMQKTPSETAAEDTLGKCRIGFKTARALGRHVRDNEFKFTWVYAKANVESIFDGKEESFDIKVRIRKDSAMLVSIQYLLGVEVAKALITKDSVKFVNYIQKTYFKGDFNYINEMLNADLDFDLLQAVLFGNSAEFQDDEAKLKPATDKQNCLYMLSTERKRRLKRIQAGTGEIKNSMQTLTLKPDYKIIRNEFIEPSTNRQFIASYSNFTQKDSVFAPYHVDIDIIAQKKANLKIEYVRIEKNTPQKLTLNIPSKYDAIQIRKKDQK